MFEGKFEVRDQKAEAVLKDIGELLRASMPEGYGFALLIASFGAHGNMFYTANCARDSVCNMMREFIQKSEHN